MWHSLYANTHCKHEYSVLNSIWPKTGLSEYWNNTCQIRVTKVVLLFV